MAQAPGKKSAGAKNNPAEAGSAKPKRSAGFVTMVMCCSIIMTVLFKETVLLLTIGMIPTGVAYLIDSNPKRYATKTVAWANLAGALIIALELWKGEISISSAIDLLQNPINWLIMLGSATIGWIINWIVPLLVLRYLGMSMEMRRRSFREKLKELEKEWGTQIRGTAPLEELAEMEAGPVAEDDTDTEKDDAMERAREEDMDDETYADFKKD
ncbi:MAG: hypothetical protein P1V34_15955 [Alphaproteobacteria bacterium]|nr:hypothetical protein [Alphaproteobacteria bacterium]